MSETPREAELQQRNERLERENTLLRQKIDALIRRLFGRQSEQLDAAQLQLLLQGVEETPPSDPATPDEPALEVEPASPHPPTKHERTARLPEHLPVIEEVLDPAPVKACPAAWRCIGAEISEQLDYEPARFLRRRLIRRKFVRRGEADATPIIAPLPPCLQERGLPTAGLLAQVLIAKYADHLPLYRQEMIYRQRHGVHLPRQTLARWVGLAAGSVILIVASEAVWGKNVGYFPQRLFTSARGAAASASAKMAMPATARNGPSAWSADAPWYWHPALRILGTGTAWIRPLKEPLDLLPLLIAQVTNHLTQQLFIVNFLVMGDLRACLLTGD